MFTEIAAEGFKSWRELPRTRLAPVSGFFGANSSGKTSVLQLLLLLKQTSTATDRRQALQFGDERSPAQLGSLRDVMFNHNTDEALQIEVAWRPEGGLSVADPIDPTRPLFEASQVEFRTRIVHSKGAPLVEALGYRTESLSVDMALTHSNAGRRAPAQYELTATLDGRDYLKRTQGRAWPLPAPVKCYGFPDEAIAYYQNSGFLGDLELAFDRQFTSNLFYLGPLRSHPERQYTWHGTEPQDVGLAGERAVEVLLSSQSAGRTNARAFDARGYAKRRMTLEEHVAEWLQELGLIHSFDLDRLSDDAEIYRVRVQKTPKAPSVLLTDVGFGVSQILPVLVLLAWAQKGSTVLLEQPEIHLHPAVQSGLADVILETASIRGVQVLIESHSEHLLRRLQRRVAEDAARPEDIALYFCSLGDDASSAITELQMNVLGEIANWPEGFFGDPLGETAAITRAALLKRQAGR